MRSKSSAVLVSTLALTLLTPSRADACWDGISMHSAQTHIAIMDDDPWADEASVENSAEWLTQIDALLPEGVTVDASFNQISIGGDENGLCSLDGIDTMDAAVSFESVFDLVAQACGNSKGEIAAALEQRAVVYTIQLLSTSDEAAADAIARELNEYDCRWQGFYVAGGFPSMNRCAEVYSATLADGREVYRVTVGNFLSTADAELVRVEIEATIGREGMIRRAL